MFLFKCFLLAQNKDLSNFECATIFEVIKFVSSLKVQSDLCRNITKYEDTLETFALGAIGNRGKRLVLILAGQHCTSCKYSTSVTFIKILWVL